MDRVECVTVHVLVSHSREGDDAIPDGPPLVGAYLEGKLMEMADVFSDILISGVMLSLSSCVGVFGV